MAYSGNDLWRSKRLVYRGIISPEDDMFLLDQANDSHALTMAYSGLAKPPTRAGLESVKEYYESLLLAVIISIPNPSPESEETAAAAAAAASDLDSSAAKSQSPRAGIDEWTAKQKTQLIDIGTITLQSRPPNIAYHRNTGIGLNIREQHRGKGYGPEAIMWALGYAFDHAGMHRVHIGSFGCNEKAWKLYEKLGFKHEGRTREALWRFGEWHDIVDLGMLESEWRELKAKQLLQ